MSDAKPTQNPKKLIELARAGNQQAFGLLYDQFAVPLFRYIYFRVQRKEDAEDILQQVFLKAYRSLDQFRSMGKEPLAYFYTIARNTVIDHQRKKKDVPVEDAELYRNQIPDEQEPIAQLISVRSEVELVKNALHQLSDDQQEVLTLRYVNDLDNHEIAVMLGKSEVAVRQLISRGIRALREILS